MAFKHVNQDKETLTILPWAGLPALLSTWCVLLAPPLFPASKLPSVPQSLSFLPERIPSILGTEQLAWGLLTLHYID